MTDLELYKSFVESFKQKIERIALKKDKCRQEAYWRNISPEKFEEEIGKWYLSQGYDVRVTQPSKDGGVDIVLTKDNELTYVQCKHYQNKRVGEPACRELGGVMLTKRVKKGVIVTLEGVTKKAKDYCEGAKIKIVTLRTLLRSNKDTHRKVFRSLHRQTLPFQSNLPTPFEEREVYGYYIYGNVFPDYEKALNEMINIPISNLTNLYDTKAVVKYKDHFFIIYSSDEKIKWLGWYVYRYLDVSTGKIISPKSIII